jgi:hypothetical protein
MTIDCPHCGKPTDLLLAVAPEQPSVPRRVIFWTVFTVLILILGLGAALVALNKAQKLVGRPTTTTPVPAAATTAQREAPPPADDPATKAGFKVGAINLEKTTGSSLIYALGTVMNPTNRQRFGVKVELDLFDAAGKKVATATDYQQVIEPKGRWQFKALVVDSKAATAKLASIKEDQ